MIPVAQCVIPEFDKEKHVYYVDGQKVPGVSEILRGLGLSKEYGGVSPFYAERGTAVHKAIEYLLAGELDEDTLDPLLVPYINGFKAWWKDRVFPSLPPPTEVRLYSRRLNYAGTVDLLTLPDEIWDYKCSKDPDPAFELQGLLYENLVLENFGVTAVFRVLQLPGENNFKVLENSESLNVPLLESIMSLWRWKTKNRRNRVR